MKMFIKRIFVSLFRGGSMARSFGAVNPRIFAAMVFAVAMFISAAVLAADYVWTFTTGDFTPPVQSEWSPASGSTLPSTSQAITLTLNESGDCKWSLTDQTYAAMTNACSDTDATHKSCPVVGLSQGANIVSIACSDTHGNAHTAATNTDLNYIVDITTPVQSEWNPASGSTLPATSQTITLTIDKSGDCKWSLTDQTYAAMTNVCDDTDATHKSCAVTGLSEGANTVSIACRDIALHADTAATNTDLNYTVDTTAPAQSEWSPASGTTLPSTSQTITLTLNESGDCKWSLTDQTYAAMTNVCSDTDATHKSCAATGLSEGANTVFIACSDTHGNADTAATNTELNYTVDTAPPVQSELSPVSGSTLTATSQAITLTIDKSGDCKWSLTDQTYAAMTNACDDTDATHKSCAVTGLSEGANTVSIACSDTYGNADTAATNTDLNYTVDTIQPTVLSVVPTNNATGVALGTTVTATFSEAMDPATITTATFTLMQGVTEIPGSVVYVDVTATFTPDSALDELTTYTATIKTGPTGAKDVAGNELVGN